MGKGVRALQTLVARPQGVAASHAMVERMRAAGLTDDEIATYVAQWHTQPIPPRFTVPQLVGERLGAVGIATTRIPGVAANFGDSGVVYLLRMPRGGALRVPPWGLAVENEWVVLNRVPQESILEMIPASRVPALTVSPSGKLVLAR